MRQTQSETTCCYKEANLLYVGIGTKNVETFYKLISRGSRQYSTFTTDSRSTIFDSEEAGGLGQLVDGKYGTENYRAVGENGIVRGEIVTKRKVFSQYYSNNK